MDAYKQTALKLITNFLHDAVNCASLFWAYLVSTVVTIAAIQVIYLAYRFLRIKLSARVVGSGDKAIIITGATSGIGLAVAKHVYKLGFSVFACYFNDKEPGYAELEELGRKSADDASLFLVHMDVRSQESIAKAGEEIELKLRKHSMKLHCLLNNAGLGGSGSFEWIDHKTINNTLDTNLRGALLVTRQFVFRVVQDKGRILNVSSGLSTIPRKDYTVYGLTKSAIDYFSECLDHTLRPYGAMCCYLRPADLTASSNIVSTRYQTMKQLTENLSEAEKELYQKSLNEYQTWIHKILVNKLKNSDQAGQLSVTLNSNVPDLATLRDSIAKQGKKPSYIKRLRRSFIQMLAGVDSKKKIEDTGILTAFEYAIRAERPLGILYPGPPFFSYIIGPYFALLPQPLMTKFARSVVRL